MSRISSLWRHPIKALGRESIGAVTLNAAQAMPMDRTWALAHEKSKATNGEWARCVNFIRCTRIPTLMAITAQLDEAQNIITLQHPNRPDLSFDPDADPQALIDWVSPLIPADQSQPAQLLRIKTHGYSDTDYPSVSIANLASHRALEAHLGFEISMHRWRANIWLEGLAPWEEFNWVGKKLAIGDAVVFVKEPALRCTATKANPRTGQADVDTLGALKAFGHQDFSVLVEVKETGNIAIGDSVRVL